MDPLILVFVGGLAIALAVAAGAALGRGRELERLREATGAAGADGDLERSVRRLIDRAAGDDFRARQADSDRRYLGDLVGIGVVRLADDGRIDFANAAAHGLLGLPPGALLGRTAMEAFVDPRVEEVAEDARRRGASADEVRLRDHDERTLVVRARRSPTRGTWLVLDDVTELRRLQQIRTEFIDNLSHELRTPLTTISLLAETLAREADATSPPIGSRMRDRIGKIEIETGHLVQMVTELLDLTRIEARGPLEMLDRVDVARLARDSIERLRLFAERQGVELSVDAETDLPAVPGNEERLGQVLVNLLHNAVKFSPQGGPVSVHVRRAGPGVEVAIEDHGVGIPAAARARVFERFYKVDRARVRGGGTGLGLAISRHIVEAHGGRIRLESTEGEGSTFTIELPIEPPIEPPTDAPIARPAEASGGAAAEIVAAPTGPGGERRGDGDA